MALANCKSCGRLFDNIHRDICNNCVREEEEKYNIVRNYLKENRHASTAEVSDATEVELSLIIKFIREGRLTVADSPNLHYPCESCGTPITIGRFCKSCTDRLNKGLEQTKNELQQASQEKNERGDYFSRRLR